MKVKTMKILVTVATVLLIVAMGTNMVQALSLTPEQISGTDPSTSDIQELGGKILGIVQTVGVVLSVLILSVLGIKYMMGSAEEKAEYKKTFIPYIVGAVLVFLAPTIANMVYSLVSTK